MESKIEATKRLQRDGRWDEASAYRDQIRTELRDEGMTRKQAGETAWARMIEEFPPLATPMSESEQQNCPHGRAKPNPIPLRLSLDREGHFIDSVV